jgi:mRNA-degrading endonuclease RelE of RelBE toxin-antitoxin system
MAEYNIYFRKSVEKDFSPIPKKDIQKILRRIQQGPNNPSNMPAINYGPLAPYKDNWQVFDIE